MYTHEVAERALWAIFSFYELEHVGEETEWFEADDEWMVLKNNFKSQLNDDVFSYSLIADNKINKVDVEIKINFNFPEQRLIETLLLVNKRNEEFNSYGVYLDIDRKLLLIRSAINFTGYSSHDEFDNFKFSKLQHEALFNLLVDVFGSINIRSHFPFDSH